MKYKKAETITNGTYYNDFDREVNARLLNY